MALALLGAVLAVVFAIPARINPDPRVWFTSEYYSQFLPIVISVMLVLGGGFLAMRHGKAKFYLALFGHTASEEALFSWLGLTQSSLPPWALWLFFALSLVALWLAYSRWVESKKLSVWEALFGVLLGALLVLLPKFL